jgi:hypothetical protein
MTVPSMTNVADQFAATDIMMSLFCFISPLAAAVAVDGGDDSVNDGGTH